MLIVLPVVSPKDIQSVLGPWLVQHVEVSRNMVRFLLPKDGLPNIYDDRDLIITARCAMFSKEWGESESQYDTLYKRRFQPELVAKSEGAVRPLRDLARLGFPESGAMHVSTSNHHKASGGGIPAAVEKHIRENFFAPEDFENLHRRCRYPW